MAGFPSPNRAVVFGDPIDSIQSRNPVSTGLSGQAKGQVSVNPDDTIQMSSSGLSLGHSPSGAAAAVVLATSGTIPATPQVQRFAPAAAITGVIMAKGTYDGQVVIVVNESGGTSTITFAAAATSNVADGASAVIAITTQKMFVWDTATQLWYHN